jgi:hypothetical protein
MAEGGQAKKARLLDFQLGRGRKRVVPNHKLKLLGRVREVLSVKHCALRTEQAWCDWIRREPARFRRGPGARPAWD